jgi:SAM-dependent methyltransferase
VDGLGDIYDRKFFAEYGANSGVYASACAFIAREIARRFQPETAVDWGCGTGLHAAALAECGVAVTAVDGVRADQDLLASNIDVRIADLTQPIPDNLVTRPYDLSLCIDVMEHLFERDANQALINVTNGAGVVILSCAPPGQGGHHHVNEQPRRYWVKRMAELGWRYDRRETGAMERYFLANRDSTPLSWMYHNLCIYRPA